jgi:hypothetical protein
MNILELVEKLDAIGLYASNEDLMMLEYEGGIGTVEFTDDNGVGYYFAITDNHFDMNAAGHTVQIRYHKRICMDNSVFCVFTHKSGSLVEIEASIIFLNEDELFTRLQKAIESFAGLELK